MTRGRHRQSSPFVATLPLAAVGALALSGGALALMASDTRLLRLGVSCSVAAAVSLGVLLRVREREQARELATEVSARWRDQLERGQETRGLRDTVAKLDAELVALREDLAEVTAAHSAAVLAQNAAARPAERLPMELRPIELGSLSRTGQVGAEPAQPEPAQPEPAQPEVAAPEATQAEVAEPEVAEAVAVEPEADEAHVIDLTAHDDTQPLRLTGVRKRA